MEFYFHRWGSSKIDPQGMRVGVEVGIIGVEWRGRWDAGRMTAGWMPAGDDRMNADRWLRPPATNKGAALVIDLFGP
ncbi:MAG TPA: hypothetical protein VHY08_20310 [Bacillota bacterium]|nr:hypothetical protein [Bacillota bacterium]